MKKIITIFLLSVNTIYGQLSLFQDKKGETSILMSNGNSLFINAADASFSFSKSVFTNDESKPFWGGAAKFKASDGIASLIDGYTLNPSFSFSFFGGKYLESKNPSKKHYLFILPSFNNTNFKLLENNILENKTFSGLKVQLGYNRIGYIGGDVTAKTTLFGIGLSYGKNNNLDDLKNVDTYNNIQNGTTLILKDKKSGKIGDYNASNGLRLNTDFAIFPFENLKFISLGGYFRGQFGGFQPRQNLGLGMFVGKKGSPTNIVFGAVYQIGDIFNQLEKEKDLVKRSGLNLIAGYSF